jgi:inner membrane protein
MNLNTSATAQNVRLFIKLIILGGLSIAILIALFSIKGLVWERQQRLKNVENDIAESYAGPQLIAGPYVVLNLRERWIEQTYNKEKNVWFEEPKSLTRNHYVYPDSLQYQGGLAVDERSRGIFKARVFQSEGELSGSITLPGLSSLKTKEAGSIELIDARAVLLIKDPRGISRIPKLSWAGTEIAFTSGTGLTDDLPGIQATLKGTSLETGQQISFHTQLYLHGMDTFAFSPLASENAFLVNSPWPHPSFQGNFLPVSRKVSESGFDAEWRVNGLASNARQVLTDTQSLNRVQSLGVKLIDPITPYPLTDRALKCGFLFVFITFASFFFFEVMKKLRIHPIQYGCVGMAQALFFLVLLSLSEHISFGWSYLLASTATITLLTIYLAAVLGETKRGLGFGIFLAGLYGALFGMLQSEDYALLTGSLLLFGLLALLMILTRNLDWYALTSIRKSEPLPPILPQKTETPITFDSPKQS